MTYTIINYTDCSQEQIRDIYRMRNLPEIRQFAYDPTEISYDRHLKFIESLKDNAQRYYYAVYSDSQLIGCYNLQFKSDGIWERGIFTIPLFQGKGETLIWENQILSNLDKQKFRIIEARVKEDNIASIKYHEKTGFVKIGKHDNYIIYNKQL